MEQLNEYTSFSVGEFGLASAAGAAFGGYGAVAAPLAMVGLSGMFGNLRANTRLSAGNRKLFANYTQGMREDSRDQLLDHFIGQQASGASEEQIISGLGVASKLRQSQNANLSDTEKADAFSELYTNLSGKDVAGKVESMIAGGGVGAGDFYNTVSQELYGKEFSELESGESLALKQYVGRNDKLSDLRSDIDADIDPNKFGRITEGGSEEGDKYRFIADTVRQDRIKLLKSKDYRQKLEEGLFIKKDLAGFSDRPDQFLEEIQEEVDDIINTEVKDLQSGKDTWVAREEKIAYLASDESRYSDYNPIAAVLG